MGMMGSLMISPSGTESCYISSSSVPWWITRIQVEVRCHHPCPQATGVTIQVSSPCYWCPWYISNRQVHEDLGIPLFADHIRALTVSFIFKLADVGKSLARQLGRYLRWSRVISVAWRESQGRQRL